MTAAYRTCVACRISHKRRQLDSEMVQQNYQSVAFLVLRIIAQKLYFTRNITESNLTLEKHVKPEEKFPSP